MINRNFAATANVPMGSASHYLQQLCKHWQDNLEDSFTLEKGSMFFPKTHVVQAIPAMSW